MKIYIKISGNHSFIFDGAKILVFYCIFIKKSTLTHFIQQQHYYNVVF